MFWPSRTFVEHLRKEEKKLEAGAKKRSSRQGVALDLSQRSNLVRKNPQKLSFIHGETIRKWINIRH